MRLRREANPIDVPAVDIESLFPDRDFRSNGLLKIRNLPTIVRPVIEYIHDNRPDIVIAGDRGGRFFALAAIKSWRHRYPDEHFPTASGKIHLARISKRSADARSVSEAAKWTMQQAGLDTIRKHAETDGKAPTILYMDDWAVYGGTIERFIAAAKGEGFRSTDITYATVCGNRVHGGFTHIIGDPSINPRKSEWDREGGSESRVGVYYGLAKPTIPVPDVNPSSSDARIRLSSYVEEYYRKFDAAVQAGSVVACSCIHIEPVLESVSD